MQGETYHWTVSSGFSLAEACNFYTVAGDLTLPHLDDIWRRLENRAKRANSGGNQGHHERISVVATFRDILRSGGLLA